VSEAAFVFFLFFGALALAWRVESPFSNSDVFAGVAVFSVVAFVALIAANDHHPYASGGDDLAYYMNSLGQFDHLADWFSTRPFADTFAQAGYPLLLTWIGNVVGPGLVARKAFNLFLFIVLSLAWYDIGRLVAGRRLARITFAAVLLCTPLWYHWLFLLKDMTIILLQGLFLWALVRIQRHGASLGMLAALLLSTLLLIPFRVGLILINMAVLVALLGAALLRVRVSMSRRSTRLILAILVTSGVAWALGSERSVTDSMGAHGDDRVISAEGLTLTLSRIDEGSAAAANRGSASSLLLAPLRFMLGDITALSPVRSSLRFDEALRGWVTVPWILVGVPLFLLGLYNIVSGRFYATLSMEGALATEGGDARMASRRLAFLRRPLFILDRIGGHWIGLLAFLLVYLAFSWVVNDYARWKLPAMPLMACIAAAGWATSTASTRLRVLLGWTMSAAAFAVVYYVVR
jgi:hypothetical protein